MRLAPFLRLALLFAGLASAAVAAAQSPLQSWITTADGQSLIAPRPAMHWSRGTATDAIVVNDHKRFQTIDGFGHALTGGSAQLLMKMSPGARASLLKELFGTGPNDVHTTYLRVSVGSSDMNDHAWTYDDMPAGETDPSLAHFQLGEDERDVIPVLREILAIQPHIHILASPWSAPAWMKDNDSLKGGALKHELYETYARYWVRYLTAMKAHGIHITALTPQNEPENPNNLPSMVMTADEEADFIGQYLGPALKAAGIDTRIIAFDHNCDHPNYGETVLANAKAARFTDGVGFHLYLGEISALTQVHDAFPDKNIYFTEQMVIPGEDPTDHSIAVPVARILIGATQNWSRNVLLWNLAADPHNGPHTSNGGCPVCTGALTLDGDHVTRLTAFYTIAQVSKFVPPGSVRIASDAPPNALPHVAFRTPQGRHVLVVSNPHPVAHSFTIVFNNHKAATDLPGKAVATYVW